MKSLHKLLLGGFLIAATGSLIAAAPGGIDEDAGDSVSIPGGKGAQLSPAEMTASSDSMMRYLNGSLRHVTQLHEKAQREKDIIRLNCVNDKLVPLKGQVNVAEASRHALDQAIGNGDESGRYATYADLVESYDKGKELRDAADACVGDALTYVGSTDVQVTGPLNPVVPGNEGIFGGGIEPPAYKTPFD